MKSFFPSSLFLPTAALILACAISSCRTPNEPAAQVVTSADASAFDGSVVQTWYALELRLIQQTPGYTPPVASRTLGYTGVALYESVVQGAENYASLAGQLNGFAFTPAQRIPNTEYHWAASANAALAAVMRGLFPASAAAAIDSVERSIKTTFPASLQASTLERSETFGKTVAAAVLVWAASDGAGATPFTTNFPTWFTPIGGAGAWVPTTPTGRALQPLWGENRTFVAANAAPSILAPTPPPYSAEIGSEFYRQARATYDASKSLTPEERIIALFWADDPAETFTPPGHSANIALQVLRGRTSTVPSTPLGASLIESAETMAKTGIAVADAFICCWKSKYIHSVLRPVTYIQRVIEPSWTPLLNTPMFPEYTSGHACQSSAAAQTLASLYGATTAFTDSSHGGRGFASRRFTSFAAFADEAGVSRIYGGIHYPMANTQGNAEGKRVGANVAALTTKTKKNMRSAMATAARK
jgi:hypothetical protein